MTKKDVMLSKIAPYYYIVAWICLSSASIFVVTNAFVDSILYPKWIITAMLAVVFIFFSLPFFFFSKNIPWVMVYKQICRYTNIIVLFEALLAIFQIVGLVSMNTSCYAGTFDNTAGLSACLAISYPMGFVFFKEYNKYERFCFCIVKLVCLFALIVYESRIGCVTMILILFLVLFNKHRYKYWLVVFLVVTALVLSACFVKTQSTIGRWFIIERTMELIQERPMTGWGIGGFTKEYMNAQADYFCCYPESPYGLLADNIHHPLNEFLLLAVNYGVPCMTLVLICCMMVFLYYAYHRSPYGKEGCYIFMSILIMAFFSYPFSYPFTWLLLILSVVLVFSVKLGRIKRNRPNLTITFLLWSINALAFVPLSRTLEFHLSWKDASSQTRNPDASQSLYNSLYQCGRNNYHFLYDYACDAYDKEQYELALDLSYKAERYISDYELTMLIGDCCQSLNYQEDAMWHYQRALQMCPSRLMPLYEIYNIYSSRNDTVNCVRLYKQINHKEIKIKNQITEMIIKDVNQDIKRFITN